MADYNWHPSQNPSYIAMYRHIKGDCIKSKDMLSISC